MTFVATFDAAFVELAMDVIHQWATKVATKVAVKARGGETIIATTPTIP
jgi:hypothetical protein